MSQERLAPGVFFSPNYNRNVNVPQGRDALVTYPLDK